MSQSLSGRKRERKEPFSRRLTWATPFPLTDSIYGPCPAMNKHVKSQSDATLIGVSGVAFGHSMPLCPSGGQRKRVRGESGHTFRPRPCVCGWLMWACVQCHSFQCHFSQASPYTGSVIILIVLLFLSFSLPLLT